MGGWANLERASSQNIFLVFRAPDNFAAFEIGQTITTDRSQRVALRQLPFLTWAVREALRSDGFSDIGS